MTESEASGHEPRDVDELIPMRPLDFSVLVALADADDYGYGIVKRIRQREGGAIHLAPGNLYQVLDRMIDAGLIEQLDRRDEADGRRRYYGITPFGREVAGAEAQRLRAVVDTAEALHLASGSGV